MKKVLISIALSLACTLSFSQERVNTTTYLQFDKTTKALKKVMGYTGVAGEWESYKNKVNHGSLRDSQNFIKLTIKTVTYNDSLYYVLIRNCDTFAPSDYIVKSGDIYKYRSGGGRLRSDVLFFFTAAEFEQIFNLDKDTKTIYSFRWFADYKERSDFSELPFSLLKEDKLRPKDFMNIRIADDGEMVRFLLPYHKDQTWDKDEELFPICYFEMPLKDFNKWLEPVSPINK